MSAYNNGVPPPPYGGKVHEAGARVQLSKKKSLGPAQIHAGPNKNNPTGSRKHTSKSPTFFVTLGPKKNPVRSKKHVQVQKKGAQVQKTCIPFLMGGVGVRNKNNKKRPQFVFETNPESLAL